MRGEVCVVRWALLAAPICAVVHLGARPAFAEQTQSTSQPFAAVSSSTLTRPANTTTYTANTGWSNSPASYLEFKPACRVAGGQVLIEQIDIYSSANPSKKLAGHLFLFSAVPSAPIADNAPFTLASVDFEHLTGNQQGFPFVLANSQASAAANSGVSLTGTSYRAQCSSDAAAIYGLVQVTNAYAPAKAEVLTVRIHTLGLN
jgi:hypothetical protein